MVATAGSSQAGAGYARLREDGGLVETSLDTHSLALAVAGLAVAVVVFCLVDLVRARQVRYLPKWAWAIFCLGIGLTIPFGGILYLAIARDRSPRPSPVPS